MLLVAELRRTAQMRGALRAPSWAAMYRTMRTLCTVIHRMHGWRRWTVLIWLALLMWLWYDTLTRSSTLSRQT